MMGFQFDDVKRMQWLLVGARCIPMCGSKIEMGFLNSARFGGAHDQDLCEVYGKSKGLC